MNPNKDEGNKSNEDSRDDEYGEFEGAEMEDEAPEAVQAHAGPSPWATFPDLLRVQSSNNKNSNASNNSSSIEDDPPESLSFSHNRPTHNNSNNHHHQIMSSGSRRETGAIPKMRPLAPPDVSQIGSSVDQSHSSKVSTSRSSDLLEFFAGSSSSGTALASSSSGGAGASVNVKGTPVVPASRISNLSYVKSQPGSSYGGSLDRYRPATNSKLQSPTVSGGCDNPPLGSRGPPPSLVGPGSAPGPVAPSSLTTNSVSTNSALSIPPSVSVQQIQGLTEAMARLQTSIDTLSHQMNDRLSNLETRLNNLDLAFSSGASLAAEGGQNDNLASATKLRNALRDEIRLYSEQQRRDFDSQHRVLLATFAEIFRRASESTSSSSSSSQLERRNVTGDRDLNGPH